MIDEILMQICSINCEWININVVRDFLKKYDLTDEEIKLIIDFLLKYLLEADRKGEKIRPVNGLRNLYR